MSTARGCITGLLATPVLVALLSAGATLATITKVGGTWTLVEENGIRVADEPATKLARNLEIEEYDFRGPERQRISGRIGEKLVLPNYTPFHLDPRTSPAKFEIPSSNAMPLPRVGIIDIDKQGRLRMCYGLIPPKDFNDPGSTLLVYERFAPTAVLFSLRNVVVVSLCLYILSGPLIILCFKRKPTPLKLWAVPVISKTISYIPGWRFEETVYAVGSATLHNVVEDRRDRYYAITRAALLGPLGGVLLSLIPFVVLTLIVDTLGWVRWTELPSWARTPSIADLLLLVTYLLISSILYVGVYMNLVGDRVHEHLRVAAGYDNSSDFEGVSAANWLNWRKSLSPVPGGHPGHWYRPKEK